MHVFTYFLKQYRLYFMKNRGNNVTWKKRRISEKILQDCDYTEVCFREEFCAYSIIGESVFTSGGKLWYLARV